MEPSKSLGNCPNRFQQWETGFNLLISTNLEKLDVGGLGTNSVRLGPASGSLKPNPPNTPGNTDSEEASMDISHTASQPESATENLLTACIKNKYLWKNPIRLNKSDREITDPDVLLNRMIEATEGICDSVFAPIEATTVGQTYYEDDELLKGLRAIRTLTAEYFIQEFGDKLIKDVLPHYLMWSNVYFNQVGSTNVERRSKEVTIKALVDRRLDQYYFDLVEQKKPASSSIFLDSNSDETAKESKVIDVIVGQDLRLLNRFGPQWAERYRILLTSRYQDMMGCLQKDTDYCHKIEDQFKEMSVTSIETVMDLSTQHLAELRTAVKTFGSIKNFKKRLDSMIKGARAKLQSVVKPEILLANQARKHAVVSYANLMIEATEPKKALGTMNIPKNRVLRTRLARAHGESSGIITAAFYQVPDFAYSRLWTLNAGFESSCKSMFVAKLEKIEGIERSFLEAVKKMGISSAKIGTSQEAPIQID